MGTGFKGDDSEPDPWHALSAADLVGILDHLSDGILVVDAEWRIRYANEPAGMMVGRRHPDLWFESRIYPQVDKLVMLFRDVTEQQLSEDEMREYVAGVSAAERIIGFGVWKWDIDAGRVRWSDELHRIYGMQPGEMVIAKDDDVPRFMGAKKMSLHQTGFQEVIACTSLAGKLPESMVLIGVQPHAILAAFAAVTR